MTREKQRHNHFARVSRLTANAIKDFSMIEDGDRILVGLSGGEDSMVLMHVLKRLQHRAPIHFDILAVTVDMNFATTDIDGLRRYCVEHGWAHRVVAFDGKRILEEKGAGDRPCSLCSRLRRGAIHAIANDLRFNKLALGQQLDDLCVSFLMSVFRGGGVKTMGPHVPADGRTKRLIRPLCYVPKALIHKVGLTLGLPHIKGCPYLTALDENGDRAYIDQLLNNLEAQFPNVRRHMLASMKLVEVEHLLDPAFLPHHIQYPERSSDNV